MKKIFLVSLVSVSLNNAAESTGQQIKSSIINDQVKQLREMILDSKVSYHAIAGHFFMNYEYSTFFGPNSPLDPLCKDVHALLEENDKKSFFWRMSGTKSERLRLLHTFLIAVQERNPKNTYQDLLNGSKNKSLRETHDSLLESFSSHKKNRMKTIARIQVVVNDIETRRSALQTPKRHAVLYEGE